MIKTILILVGSNIIVWLPFGYPEEMTGTIFLVRGFVAIATVIAVVLSTLNYIDKTTRKCTCGNYNDKTDTTCTSCKQSII